MMDSHALDSALSSFGDEDSFVESPRDSHPMRQATCMCAIDSTNEDEAATSTTKQYKLGPALLNLLVCTVRWLRHSTISAMNCSK